jgi:SlyX protein
MEYLAIMDQQDAETRLEKIETRLAYLEDLLLRLQEEAVKNAAALTRMESGQRTLKSRLLQMSRDLEEFPDRKPPHY